MSQAKKILLDSNLQSFFYEVLQDFNLRSSHPVRQEAIFYSSLVMNQYNDSTKYFEQVDNRIREKVLGIKLMEATQLPKEKQKQTLKDIADTSLLVCGFFNDSLNKKLVDARYYQEIGKMAFCRLNSFTPEAYNVPSFFKLMSLHFSDLTLLMSLASKKYSKESDPQSSWIIEGSKKIN